MENVNLEIDNDKLVKDFGASRASDLKDIPDCYTFKKGLIYSHRDFDKFFKALKKGKNVQFFLGLMLLVLYI